MVRITNFFLNQIYATFNLGILSKLVTLIHFSIPTFSIHFHSYISIHSYNGPGLLLFCSKLIHSPPSFTSSFFSILGHPRIFVTQSSDMTTTDFMSAFLIHLSALESRLTVIFERKIKFYTCLFNNKFRINRILLQISSTSNRPYIVSSTTYSQLLPATQENWFSIPLKKGN